MSSTLVDPPKMPRESTRDPNEPRTLHTALETIADLRAELQQLKGAPGMTAPTAAAKPAAKTLMPIADLVSHGFIINPETPVTALDHLRVALNQASSKEEKQTLYRAIKNLEAEQSGPRPRARLRGV